MTSNPSVAIIDPNTLAVIGLKQILEEVLPRITVNTFGDFSDLQDNHPERFFHYFVSLSILIAHRSFFLEHRNKTIVLVSSKDESKHLGDFHSICIFQPEDQLLKSLLKLEQSAHSHGRNFPTSSPKDRKELLSSREIEVLTLIVKGYINKEIAEKLCISLPTVVSHRKNLMIKLGAKSVSSLTIYAVMNGLVNIDDI